MRMMRMMKGWTLVALLVSGACAFVTKPSLAVVKPTRVLKSPVVLNDVNLDVMEIAQTGVSTAGMDPMVLAGAAAAVVLVAVVAAVSSSDATKKEEEEPAEPEPEPIDVSIPYDAASLLAFDEWKKANEKEDEEYDEETYQKFKSIYETMMVAQVVAKKCKRDLAKL